jgi:hypothetical protein
VRGHLLAKGQVLGPKDCMVMLALPGRVLAARRGARRAPSGRSTLDKTVRVTRSQLGGDQLLTPKTCLRPGRFRVD